VSGKYVSPAEVENTLLGHPAVWECAVVGQEDPDGLTIPVAYVVPNVGQAPSAELGRELMEFVKREIAPYKFTRRVEFLAELPKGAAGKVQRWKLVPARKQ
jgi:benzoate-CoA ligase